MTNTKSFGLILTASALLGSFVLAACAEKHAAQTTTTASPASAAGTGDQSGPERVRTLQREHNQLVKAINDAGQPTAQWDVPRLDAYREQLKRLNEIEVTLAKLDAVYAEEMRRSGHADRIAGKLEALDQVLASVPR